MPSCLLGRRTVRALALVVAVYVALSGYLAAEASPSVFYVANVFAHFFGGLVLAVVVLAAGVQGVRAIRGESSGAAWLGGMALVLLVAATLSALALATLHNTRETRWILDLHVGLSIACLVSGLLALAVHARRGAGSARMGLRVLGAGTAAGALLWAGLPLFGARSPGGPEPIDNPDRPPFVMEDEAMGGSEGPFFPSSAATSTGGRIPSNFFMTSETCQRCHGDIYEQWTGSAHHFSSFNNQWYRKSIEYMQEVNSVQSSKWCAGCHDHAVLFNGMMDEPVSSFLATQEAHTGVACNSCHAITKVRDTMGNGAFHVEYPPLHDMAVSEKPLLRWMHDFAVQLDPGPHKNVFMKPFHREQTAEFCSSCHKVHLDLPVNNYRWIRGFNEYDNWQASGVSGQGARAFYYPAQPMDCADCHMPRVESDDKGNIDGYVHDHSFLAANTALPVANLHESQLARTIEFLQKNQVTLDIFAAGTARPPHAAEPRIGSQELMTSFGVGEESAMAVGGGSMGTHDPGPLWGPLNRAAVAVKRGEEIRVDVVARTRGVGHFFPGGTVDGFDVWMELRAYDETGKTVFWSGVATEGGEGPVDEGAHRYGNRMVDAHGNRIDRRNAWATRAVAWVNLIPPGAADVAHFRLEVPEDCGEKITLEARLNYRKFSHANTRFAFAERPAPGEPKGSGPGIDRVTPHFDNREFLYDEVPMDVSAALREIPDLPIVVVSRATAELRVAAPGETVKNDIVRHVDDSLRWNDYGIGLLLQGDLPGARRAFEMVAALDPEYADAFVNSARVALREGLLDEARASLDKALALDPALAKTNYFMGVVHQQSGEYDEAVKRFRVAANAYPRDRVVRNDLGRTLFLQRKFAEAVEELKQVLDIDPEDLAAHYNLMLSYRGLGRPEEAEAERRLYERFKADEDADVILGPYLRENPGDNRMRQRIHEQVSVPREVLERELELRRTNGEPNVVLPGQAAEYAKRVVERGAQRIAEGQGAKRYEGPTEAGVVRPTVPKAFAQRETAATDEVASTGGGR